MRKPARCHHYAGRRRAQVEHVDGVPRAAAGSVSGSPQLEGHFPASAAESSSQGLVIPDRSPMIQWNFKTYFFKGTLRKSRIFDSEKS